MAPKTQPERAETEHIRRWVVQHVPRSWFAGPPSVNVDDDEILIVGTLEEPVVERGATEAAAAAARLARIRQFREETREGRMRTAQEAEHTFSRKVSWGARCGESHELFTTMSVPVMTRLRMGERAVLDILVASGVARSRSDALAWCVRLVGRHENDWLTDLRDALVHVHRVRGEGPTTI
jgi:hypothetical protein